MTSEVARVITIGSIVLSVGGVGLALRAARREERVRGGFEAARVVITFAVVVTMAQITAVSTPLPLIAGAIAVGGLLGVLQGRSLTLSVKDGRMMAKRTTLGIVVWGAGLLTMQVAGLFARTSAFRIGQAIAFFSVAMTVGLFFGRNRSLQLVQRTAYASTAVVAGVLLVLVAPLAARANPDDMGGGSGSGTTPSEPPSGGESEGEDPGREDPSDVIRDNKWKQDKQRPPAPPIDGDPGTSGGEGATGGGDSVSTGGTGGRPSDELIPADPNRLTEPGQTQPGTNDALAACLARGLTAIECAEAGAGGADGNNVDPGEAAGAAAAGAAGAVALGGAGIAEGRGGRRKPEDEVPSGDGSTEPPKTQGPEMPPKVQGPIAPDPQVGFRNPDGTPITPKEFMEIVNKGDKARAEQLEHIAKGSYQDPNTGEIKWRSDGKALTPDEVKRDNASRAVDAYGQSAETWNQAAKVDKALETGASVINKGAEMGVDYLKAATALTPATKPLGEGISLGYKGAKGTLEKALGDIQGGSYKDPNKWVEGAQKGAIDMWWSKVGEKKVLDPLIGPKSKVPVKAMLEAQLRKPVNDAIKGGIDNAGRITSDLISGTRRD